MIRVILIAFLLLGLVACETQAPKDTDGLRDIIPTAELDRAPKKPKDVSQVKNAVPKVEPRTAAGNKSPYKVKGVVYRVMDDPRGYKAYGTASWYGEKFHGNHTSNGERYDMYELTAAHKTLPIPSYVRVTNVENGQSIIARVNDRGPFAHGRLIDLSYAGAKKLGYIHAGTAKVKVEYIDPTSYRAAASKPITPAKSTKPPQPVNVAAKPDSAVPAHAVAGAQETLELPPSPPARIISDWRAPQRYLQVGAFGDEAAAETMKQQVSAHTSWPVFIEKGKTASGGNIFRVHIGPIPDEQKLLLLKTELMAKGLNEPLRVVR